MNISTPGSGKRRIRTNTYRIYKVFNPYTNYSSKIGGRKSTSLDTTCSSTNSILTIAPAPSSPQNRRKRYHPINHHAALSKIPHFISSLNHESAARVPHIFIPKIAQYCRWRILRSSTACDVLAACDCLIPDGAVQSLGLVGVSISEDSSDELEGLCVSSWRCMSVEPQLFLAFRDFLGRSIIGDRSNGWIRAWNTEGGGVKSFSRQRP